MSDLDRQGWFSDAIRGLFAKLDSFVYSLISGLYQIFYYVATATIIEGETVRNFYSRVQLILGVIIMFKVAISLFNGIMNPDSLNDNKNGFSSIIKRIVMVLIMLVLMVPLNIPNVGSEDSYDNNSQESWNARMNNNGILFGTLFEIQSRLLSQNTISKLILGDNDNDEEYSLDGSYSGYQLSSIILKSFVTPNVLVDGLDPEDDKNRVCSADALSSQYDDDSYADIYDQYESTMIPSNVLSMVNVSCSPEESIGQKIGTVLGTIAGGAGGAVIGGPIGLLIGAFGANTAADAIVDYQNGAYYAFSYSYIFSTLIGVLVVILLVSFTVDAAIRVFKLAILKLIAPVPILSYIDPKTESTFQNWLKMIGTTFADLFIRLGILNLIIFFIKELDSNGFGLHLDDATGIVPIFAKLFIILGLLMFAKAAPKFIADSLGIKDTGKFKLFGGLGRLQATGSMLAGTVGSAATNWRAFRQEQPKREDVLQHPIAARASNFFRRGVGAAGSALLGGAGGLITGANALSGADSDFNKNVVRAQQNRNAQRASHSTMIGRFIDRQAQLWTGQSLADRDKQALDANIKAKEAIGNFKKRAQEEARKNSNITGSVNIQGPNGTTRSVVANYEKLIAAMGAKDSSGNFTYNGGQYNVSDFDTNVLNELLKSQTNTYLSNPNNAKSVEADFKALQSAVNSSSFARDVSSYITNASTAFDNSGTLMGKAAGAVADYQYDMTHVKHMANKQANDSK